MRLIQILLLSAILGVNIQMLQAVRDLRQTNGLQLGPKGLSPKQITSVPVKLPPGRAVVELCRDACPHCQTMKKTLAGEDVVRIDVTKYGSFFNGVATPTYVVFQDGKAIKQWSGSSDLKTFKERVK